VAVKYLPRKGSRYDVYSTQPVKRKSVFTRGKCRHNGITRFSVMDRYEDRMPVYLGECCVECGKIVSIKERE
jgi:hypothetical protein